MKKLFAVAIAIALMAGCSDVSGKPEQDGAEMVATPTPVSVSTPTPESTPTPKPTLKSTAAPTSELSPTPIDEDQLFYDKINSVIAQNDLNLMVGELNKSTSVTMEITLKGATSSIEMYFHSGDRVVYFDSYNYLPIIEELVVALLLMYNEVDEIIAREQMREFIDSYNPTKFSDIISIGPFQMYVKPRYSTNGNSQLVLDDLSYRTIENTSEYIDIDFEIAKLGELYAGRKCKLEGVVKSDNRNYTDEYSPLYKALVTGKDGNDYYLTCPYAYDLEIGKSYTFYGDVIPGSRDDMPCIRADYIEK